MFNSHRSFFLSLCILGLGLPGCGDGADGSGATTLGSGTTSPDTTDTTTTSMPTTSEIGQELSSSSGVIDPTSSSTTAVTGETSTTTTTGSTGETESPGETTGETTGGADTTGTDTTGPVCMPVAAVDLTCDQVDDDCNGFVDDVDPDVDGFCDCIKIMILGNPGNAPNAKFENWLKGKGTSVVRMINPDPLTVDVLAPYDIVLIDQIVREYSAAEAKAVQDWVEAGGGLLAMNGYVANADQGAKRPNSLVAPMGVEFVPKLVNGPVKTFVAHPVTEDLSSVTFEGGHLVKETMGTNTFVASIGNDAVAVVAERGDGRIYLWGDEWVQYDMVWNGNPMIEKFWANAIAWVGPKTFCVLPQ